MDYDYERVTTDDGDVLYMYKEKGGLLFLGLHREDGPAVEYIDGGKQWLRYGKLHREDGPAMENSDGTNKWFLNGKEFTYEEFEKLVNSNSDKKTIELNGTEYNFESELWNDY